MILRVLALLLAALALSVPGYAKRDTGRDMCSGMSEREVLEGLYRQTDGHKWRSGADWMVLTDHCDWEGVDCDDAGRVTGLDLSGFGLTGALP
ncbi:hypothetical protein KIPB_014552, partial [Kipferlia bialata]|eukprot:g14552.t1